MTKTVRIVEPDDMAAIYGYLTASSRRRLINPVRTYALLCLMEQTAMRAGECRVLKMDSIRYRKDGTAVITIPDEQGAKCGSRQVPFITSVEAEPTRAMLALKAWLKMRAKHLDATGIKSDYLFCSSRGGKLSDSNLCNYVSRIAREVGVPYPVTPHMWRHTRATNLVRQDVNLSVVQGLLGHKHLRTTEIYTHINLNDVLDMSKDHPV